MIFNMNGVNYDTMRTDDEINALIGSGINACLKKELISQTAISQTVNTNSYGTLQITLPYNELINAVGIIYEFDGSFKVTFSSSSSQGSAQMNPIQSESSPALFKCYGYSSNSKTYTGQRSMLYWKNHYYDYAPDTNLHFMPMYNNNGNYSCATTTVSANSYSNVYIKTNAYAKVTVTGTIRLYALYL